MVDRIQRRGYTYISRIFVYTVYACVCVCIHIVEGSLYARENVIWQVNVADNAFRINSFLILYALNELQLDYQSSLSLPPPTLHGRSKKIWKIQFFEKREFVRKAETKNFVVEEFYKGYHVNWKIMFDVPCRCAG